MTTAEDGLTAFEAAEKIYQEPEPPKPVKSPIDLLPSGSTYVEYRPSLRVCAVLDELVKETWYATGISSPLAMDSRPQRVPAGLWGSLDLDIDANLAFDPNGDLTISDLLFYEAKPEPKLTKLAEKKCAEWLIGEMKNPRTVTITSLVVIAQEKYSGLSKKGFWRAVKIAKSQPSTDGSWHRPGPP